MIFTLAAWFLALSFSYCPYFGSGYAEAWLFTVIIVLSYRHN